MVSTPPVVVIFSAMVPVFCAAQGSVMLGATFTILPAVAERDAGVVTDRSLLLSVLPDEPLVDGPVEGLLVDVPLLEVVLDGVISTNTGWSGTEICTVEALLTV